jgi:hypothetical protein
MRLQNQIEDEDDDEYEDDWGVIALPRIPTQNTQRTQRD